VNIYYSGLIGEPIHAQKNSRENSKKAMIKNIAVSHCCLSIGGWHRSRQRCSSNNALTTAEQDRTKNTAKIN
jgi:hypothetical protein